MRYLIFLALLIATPALASINISWFDGTSSGGGATTPDYQWNLDDNAATTTIAASIGGSDGVLNQNNTEILHSTSCYEGTGCFDFSSAAGYDYATFTIDSTQLEDDTFTLQIAYNIPVQTISSRIRVVSSLTLDFLSVFFDSSNTSLLVSYRGSYLPSATINDVATGTWQVLRIVFDSGTVYVYQGDSEDTLTLVDTVTDTFGTTTGASNDIRVYGRADDATSFFGISGVGDVVKFWNGAVAP